MALYNNPYQYSFGVPGQMNQFQQQPVQMPTQQVQQPQQNNNGIYGYLAKSEQNPIW